MTSTEDRGLAPRVFQLEARYLDSEFDRCIDQFVLRLEIPKYTEELKLLVKTYIFYHYIKNATTLGLQMYKINYQGTSERSKLILFSLFNLMTPYLMKRKDIICDRLNYSVLENLGTPLLTFDNILLALKSISIINFLCFLKDGRYLHFQERLLGLTPTMSYEDHHRNVSLNRVQMDLAYREKMWSTLADFLVTVVPYINFTRIKNQLSKMVKKESRTMDKFTHRLLAKEDDRCAICRKQPFNPFVIGCAHVFCYYCIQSRYLSDTSSGYSCPDCSCNHHDASQLRRYQLLPLSQ